MLTHENCDLRVVHESYREMRQLQNNLSGDVGVPVQSEQELRGLEKRGAPSVTTGHQISNSIGGIIQHVGIDREHYRPSILATGRRGLQYQ